jgi:hypothetical protein
MSATKSSSPSLLSESLPSDSISEIVDPAYSEQDETPSLVNEFRETTLVLPLSHWKEESPVPIFLPQDEGDPMQTINNITEIKVDDILDNDKRQESLLKLYSTDLMRDAHNWYTHQDGIQTPPLKEVRETHSTTSEQEIDSAVLALAGDGLESNVTSAVDESNEEKLDIWKASAAQSKKRGREDCAEVDVSVKGKGKDDAFTIQLDSSQDFISDIEEVDELEEFDDAPSPDSTTKSGNLTEEETEVVLTPDASYSPEAGGTGNNTQIKRKIVMRKTPPHTKTVSASRRLWWQGKELGNSEEFYQWRKLVNVPTTFYQETTSNWPKWLHPAFRNDRDEIAPCISFNHLDL